MGSLVDQTWLRESVNLEDMARDASQTNINRRKEKTNKQTNKNRTFNYCETISKDSTYATTGTKEEEKRENGTEEWNGTLYCK